MRRARIWLKDNRQTVVDKGPVVLLLVLGQIETWSTGLDIPKPFIGVLAAAMTCPLFWRRRHPVAATVAVVAGVIVLSSGWALMDNFITPFAALLLATYSGAAYSSARTAWTVIGLASGLLIVGTLIDGRPIGDVIFVLVILAAVAAAGRGVHARQQRVTVLADRAIALEHERDAKARAAVAEERVRIARELHDVVAHGISVIVLQARGGRAVLGPAESEARQAFGEIESTAEGALVEMRRLLGMLRQHDEELALGPQPSLANLDALAAHVRDAGLPVDVVVNGDVAHLPPGVDLSAYRLVQEGLTNALKHAGPACARVYVSCSADEVEVEVIDNGHGLNGRGDSTGGHGLTGMRERVSMLGGQIEIGPRETGGFALRARLPLDGVA